MSALEESERPVIRNQKGARMLTSLACLVIVLAGMKAAAPLLVPIVVAFFLSVLSYPVMHWLRLRRVPNFLAMLLTVLMNVALVVGIVNAGGNLLWRFQQEIPRYLQGLKGQIDGLTAWLEEQGATGIREAVDQTLDWHGFMQYVQNENVMQSLTSLMGSTVGTVASVVTTGTLVLILLVFILTEARGTARRLAVIRTAGGPDLSKIMASASDIQKYLSIKTAISAATGLLAGGWCALFDLPYPLLWGMVAFFFNFIPAIGSIVAAVPPVLISLVQDGPSNAFGVLIGYLAINFTLGNFLEPLLLGRRFGVSSLVIVLSVLFWGWLWGIMGMFLAVPLTMIFKVLLESSDEFRWISAAMAKKKIRRGDVEVAGYDLEPVEGEMIGSGATTERPGS